MDSEIKLQYREHIIKFITKNNLPTPKRFVNRLIEFIERMGNPKLSEIKQIFCDTVFILSKIIAIQDNNEKKNEYKKFIQKIENNDFGWSTSPLKNIQRDISNEVNSVVNPVRIYTGEYTCGKCHKKTTWWTSTQTRSADEGSTVKVNCACGNRWTA